MSAEWSRRTVLRGLGGLGAGAAATAVGVGGCGWLGSTPLPPPIPSRWGPADYQAADLYLPPDPLTRLPGSTPVVVVIHGGYWRPPWHRIITEPLAQAISREGYAALNIDYRPVGEGGGWPSTFLDVAAAIDSLAVLAASNPLLDLARVAAVGHSAGGPLALWAAARSKLPTGAPGAAPKVRVDAGVVTLAGVDDLSSCATDGAGDGACQALMGATPATAPDRRFDLADPVRLLPLGVPQLVAHGTADATVDPLVARSYAAAATAKGDRVDLLMIDGADHLALSTPRGAAWRAMRAALNRFLA